MLLLKKHIKIALCFFLVAVIFGLILRFYSISSLQFQYRNLVHAHSHIAMLGWVYLAQITTINHYFLNVLKQLKSIRWIFNSSLFSVIGMMVSFPFQGYAFFSILFSSLFLISSYFYVWMFFKHLPKSESKKPSAIAIKWALIYMAISSIGPWSIGVVVATLGTTSFLYLSTIYFYLHFQYNAWMILGLIGILLKILENKNIQFTHFKVFIKLFNVSVFLTFFLSILFERPANIFYIASILGAVIQLGSLFILYQFLKANYSSIKTIFKYSRYLNLAFILLLAKTTMQLLGSFKPIAALIAQNTYLTIGFLHWIFLGVISITLFIILNHTKLLRLSKKNIYVYIIGFILTEFLIFYKPFSQILNIKPLSYYNEWLFFASLILTIAIAWLVLFQFIKKKKAEIKS